MQKIFFSKHGDTLSLKPEKELLAPHIVYLEQQGFRESEGKFELQTPDFLRIIKKIYDFFDFLEIIPNEEIISVLKEEENSARKYDEYKKLGVKIKEEKIPELPEIGLKEGLELKPYQKLPVQHMISIPNCANFSIPGTGKTLMALSAFFILKKQDKIDQMWVVGPLASFRPWEDEYSFFFRSSKIGVKRYHGNITERDRMRSRLGRYDVVLTSYGTASNDLNLIAKQWRDDKKRILLVLDESHHVKSIKEITDSGDYSNSAAMIKLGEYAKRRLILTGTPLPHEWEDLWSQITFLWPNIEPFGKRYQYQEDLKKYDPGKKIQDIINFMWTRITNKQLANEMPDRHDAFTSVKMDDKQEAIYTAIEDDFLSQIGSGYAREKVQEWHKIMTLRLLQAATNPKLIVENDPDFNLPELIIKNDNDKTILGLVARYKKDEVSPKIKQVAKKAREIISNGKSVVIFTVFRGNVKLLKEILLDEKPFAVTGEYDPLERERVYEEFKNWDFSNGKGRILIASLGSIAESVSLHKNKDGKPVCQNVIYLERSFNGGQFMQSLYRVYRIGSDQKLPVTYHYFESVFNNKDKTIDDVIKEVLDRRLKRLFKILDDEFKIDITSFDADDESEGPNELYGKGDNYHDIMKKVGAMIRKRKKKN